MEEDFKKQTEAKIRKEKEKFEKELKKLQKERDRAEEQKRLAEQAKAAADQARAAADRERELADEAREDVQAQLDAQHQEPIADLVARIFRANESKNDDDGEPAPKKKKKASEFDFDPNGLLIKPAKYEGMAIDGLILFKQVDENIRKAIARDEYFDLSKMYTGEEITTTTFGHVTVTSTSKNVPKEITQKSELFYLLYQFGQYYLQKYPTKTSGYFEYLAFLTKICDNFNAKGLVKLDSALRKEYINNPTWTWNQTNEVIDKIHQYMAKDPDNLKANASGSGSNASSQKPKVKAKPYNPFPQMSVLQKVQPQIQVQKYVRTPQPPMQPGFSGGSLPMQAMPPRPMFAPPMPRAPFRPPFNPGSGNAGKGGRGGGGKGNKAKDSQAAKIQRILQKNPNIRNERCYFHNFNAEGCHLPHCLRQHVCWNCGDPSHVVYYCPLPQRCE